MGPYYRNTSQGMGAFFDSFYQHPILMMLLILLSLCCGFVFWRFNKKNK